MDKDKSIIAKFTETMKGLADGAAEALKAEQPPKIGERPAGDMPFASAGLVSDPLPVRRRKRAAKNTAARSSTSKQKSKRGKSMSGSTPGRARASAKTGRASARAARPVKAKATRRKSAKRPAKARRGPRR